MVWHCVSLLKQMHPVIKTKDGQCYLLIRLVVWAMAAPFCMPNCPWARYWTSECGYVSMFSKKHLHVKKRIYVWMGEADMMYKTLWAHLTFVMLLKDVPTQVLKAELIITKNVCLYKESTSRPVSTQPIFWIQSRQFLQLIAFKK